MSYTISREIGIDCGHRVPTHGSKCKNVHGHRYTILAICKAEDVHEEGEQKDMILDFGFLKDEMMNEIDTPCDHGFIMWNQDELLERFIKNLDSYTPEAIDRKLLTQDYVELGKNYTHIGKMYVVDFIPTAEKLAEHWFNRLAPRVKERSKGLARLSAIKVWETPNCSAVYHSPKVGDLNVG